MDEEAASSANRRWKCSSEEVLDSGATDAMTWQDGSEEQT